MKKAQKHENDSFFLENNEYFIIFQIKTIKKLKNKRKMNDILWEWLAWIIQFDGGIRVGNHIRPLQILRRVVERSLHEALLGKAARDFQATYLVNRILARDL